MQDRSCATQPLTFYRPTAKIKVREAAASSLGSISTFAFLPGGPAESLLASSSSTCLLLISLPSVLASVAFFLAASAASSCSATAMRFSAAAIRRAFQFGLRDQRTYSRKIGYNSLVLSAGLVLPRCVTEIESPRFIRLACLVLCTSKLNFLLLLWHLEHRGW